MSASIPWEDSDGRLLDRLWTTVWSATSDPIGTFTRLCDGEPDLAASVRFALLVSIVGWSPLLLLTPCLAFIPLAFASVIPERVIAIGVGVLVAFIVALPFAMIAASVAFEVFYGALFHAIARLAGGVGDLRGSMHAMFYTSAIRFWLAAAILLGFVPFVGSMVSIGVRVAFIVWGGFACFGAARGLHKLDGNAAIAVAILTPLISTAFVSFFIVLAVLGLISLVAGGLSLETLIQQISR